MKKIYGERYDLPIEVLSKGVFRLDEFGGTNCYLIVGEQKAMLIDCGTGFCDMRKAVRQITTLPILLVATHGHVDHIGGKGQFDNLYLNEKDWKPINTKLNNKFGRKLFVAFNKPVVGNGFSPKDVTKVDYKVQPTFIGEGYKFDLGGKIVSVHETPGHTRGSIAIIDETDKIIFSGDNVCDALWMMLPGATSLEEWLPSAKWLYDMSENYSIYWGHRVAKLERDYISKVIEWGEHIIASTKKNTLFYGVKQYPNQKDGIIYRTDKVLRK